MADCPNCGKELDRDFCTICNNCHTRIDCGEHHK